MSLLEDDASLVSLHTLSGCPITSTTTTTVENITNEPAKYDPINAYEYLKWRLSLSHDTDYIPSAEIAMQGEQHIPKHQDYEN